MEEDGNWLFRRRSYTPLVPLALIVIAIIADPPPPDPRWELLCLLLGLLGLAFRAATVARVPSGTSGRGTSAPAASTLNVSGMYSIVRHPLYVGNFLMWLGAACFTRSLLLVLLVALVYWFQYERVALAEERLLRERFGASFEAWAARVPAFVPAPRLWQPAALPFSWRTVIAREFTGLYGLVATLTALDVARSSALAGRLAIQPLWLWLFAAATVFYLVCLGLRLGTRVLHVTDR